MTLKEIYRHPKAALRALTAWLLRRRVIPPLPVPAAQLPPPPVLPKPARAERRVAVEAADLAGSFFFREYILDDLDYYMLVLKRMRRADPEAFAMYSQLGAALLPYRSEVLFDKQLSPWWRENRPSFGAVAWASERRDDPGTSPQRRIAPRFWYFSKYKQLHLLRHHRYQQPPPGSDIYGVTAYWDLPNDQKWKTAKPTEFLIAIDPQHRVFPLKEFVMEEEYHPRKRKRWQPGQVRGHGGSGKVMVPHWRIHPWFIRWARQHNQTVEDFLVETFLQAACMYETSNRGMIRVAASRGDLTAIFSVDIKRTPYFFKDRGITLTSSGQRKRIFHIVRPHVRADGASVPMHFRGEREFDWNGYRIQITVPGLHHISMTDFDVGMHVYEDPKLAPKTGLTHAQTGAWLKGHIESLDGVPNSMKNRYKAPPPAKH